MLPNYLVNIVYLKNQLGMTSTCFVCQLLEALPDFWHPTFAFLSTIKYNFSGETNVRNGKQITLGQKDVFVWQRPQRRPQQSPPTGTPVLV